MANQKGIAGYILTIVIALYLTAYTVPQAIATLLNASNWEGVPAYLVTLGGTVTAIVVVFGIMIALMPESIKSNIGL